MQILISDSLDNEEVCVPFPKNGDSLATLYGEFVMRGNACTFYVKQLTPGKSTLTHNGAKAFPGFRTVQLGDTIVERQNINDQTQVITYKLVASS